MLSEFMKYVSVCIDTLAVARSIFHGKSAGHDYKQGTLVSKYLGKSYEAHNALADVQSLQELYQEKFHGRFSLSDFAFVFGAHILRSTLRELEQKKVLSAPLCAKIAKSGIGFDHLETMFKRGGLDALRALLAEPCGKGVRGTKSGKVITKLHDYFLSKSATWNLSE